MPLEIPAFIEQQLACWPLARRNYDALSQVRNRTLTVDGIPVRLQFNPARAVSSQAKLDAKTLAERPCFLCPQQRPPEQISADLFGKYVLLVNPFPITPVHLTLAAREHRPQQLDETSLLDFLQLAKAFPHYTLLFNGANAGASAPDHFHFQLTNTDYYPLPIEASTPLVARSSWSGDRPEALLQAWKSTGWDDRLCNFFVRYDAQRWTLTVFPRKTHRPTQYYDGSLLISPGAIDMTGTLVITRESDFDRITADDIRDIYRQVSRL
ncbi:MAG: DUF4922 domain-containing protein [Paludibacteraceae bacterium]|nr:DUF4922 domain-containing protein [Paludibacteraceae bacterium]